jgi:hypothetical protein
MFDQELQIIPILSPADQQAGGITTDSVNMGKLRGLQVVITTGVLTGDGATIQFYGGATAGTMTTEIFPKYRVSTVDAGAASADVFGARVTTPAGGILFTPATSFDLRTIIVDIPSDQMPNGLPWLTLQVEDGAASAQFQSIVGIGLPRFSGDTHTTAL